VLFLVAASCSATAQPGRAARPPGYFEAEHAFSRLGLDQRIKLQIMLATAGYWNAVPNATFSKRLFDSIVRFQNESGYMPTGHINEGQFEHLLDLGAPKLALWGFREIAHPERGRPIWIPVGLGMRSEHTRFGLSFREPQDRLQVKYNYYPRTSLRVAFEHLVTKFQSEGTHIHYKVLRPDFFAISSTRSNGVDGYLRYHEDGSGILGFSMFWENARGVVSGERVAVLTSGSLWTVPPWRSRARC
jgi:hypothetical protein